MSNKFGPIYFATSNENKFYEAKSILEEYNISIERSNLKRIEIQNSDLVEIAVYALNEASKKGVYPILIEDSGLFIKAYNGFPGPYSSYIYKTLSLNGILKLMRNDENREAEFKSVIAFSRIPHNINTFSGITLGNISYEPRGKYGFGFDPIFIPKGSKKTFAEMPLSEKNELSHRASAFKQFAEWYNKFSKGRQNIYDK